MKHLFFDLWANIRKSPFLFLFLFIQVFITSLILYSVLANHYWVEERSGAAQISWGDKEYFKLFFQTNAPQDKQVALLFSDIKKNGKIVPEYVELFEQVEKFYNEAKKIDGLNIITNDFDLHIVLEEPKNWDEEDKLNGTYNMFKPSSVPNYEALNAYAVDSVYLDYFNVKLSDGEYFKEEDFLYDGEYIPVLMGSTYKKYYSLGEEFTAYLDANLLKFKVIWLSRIMQSFTVKSTMTGLYLIYSGCSCNCIKSSFTRNSFSAFGVIVS